MHGLGIIGLSRGVHATRVQPAPKGYGDSMTSLPQLAAELIEKRKAATHGPWVWNDAAGVWGTDKTELVAATSGTLLPDCESERKFGNADFIAFAANHATEIAKWALELKKMFDSKASGSVPGFDAEAARERLRHNQQASDVYHSLGADITALENENAKLREALRALLVSAPSLECLDNLAPSNGLGRNYSVGTVHESIIRQARAALGEK